jgi:hypothetical protein
MGPFLLLFIGVTLNYDLSWDDHVRTVFPKVYGALAGLRICLYVTYCCPRFFIFDLLRLCTLDSNSLWKLTVALNACVRYVYFGLNFGILFADRG